MVDAPGYCGSGGCVFLVLERARDGSYKKVSASTISREPIRILPTKSHGWRDFTIRVAGGGAKPCEVIMHFNGHRYPGNPSLAPCASADQLTRGTKVHFER